MSLRSTARRTVSALPALALILGSATLALAAGCAEFPRDAKAAHAPRAVVAGPRAAAQVAGSCEDLARIRLDGVEIVSAVSQNANAPVDGARMPGMTGRPGEGAAVSGLPAFCRVVGRIRPEPGSDIGFEVWMPASGWDGRLNGVGTGGFAGSIDYLNLGLALKAGQAAVTTDTGHTGTPFESAWARGHPERVRDYGWRATHVTTVAAKGLVEAFYGRGPDHSYFVGCSNGGRQGLMEASRFPDDWDGIVVGAPAALWSDLAMAMINSFQAQLPAGAAIRKEQATLIQQAVLDQCDSLDGEADGIVADPRRCRFDTEALACGRAAPALCFTPAQLAALDRIYAGPRDRAGRAIVNAYLPSGSEVGVPSPTLGWDGYLLVGSSAVQGQAQAPSLVGGVLTDLVQSPFATLETFDFDRDPARLRRAIGGDLDAGHDLGRFYRRGGKIIMWHGWADAAIPPGATLDYYAAMLRASGPEAAASVRLYMVPGAQHCLGGTGPSSFGQLSPPQSGQTPQTSIVAALQDWVENDRAPEGLVGRRGLGGMMGIPVSDNQKQRLLCPYPTEAVLRPGEDRDRAASYQCRPPAAGARL